MIRRAEKKRNGVRCHVISDHALLRYLERVEGIDVEGIRERLGSADVAAACAAGVKEVKRDGYRLVINYQRVVTVLI